MNTMNYQMLKEIIWSPNKIMIIFFFLETYNYDGLFANEDSTDTTRESDKGEPENSSNMPPPEGDEEEVKEGK